MARIETHREIATPRPWTDVRSLLLGVLNHRRATLAIAAPTHLEARTGSQAALRLKGGWMAKPEEFPLVAAVMLYSGDPGTIVRITVADDLGFGSKVGMTKKYRQAVEDFADALAAAVAGPAACCPFGHPVTPGARYCGACGATVAVA